MDKKLSPFNSLSLLSISLLLYASGSLIAPALNALQTTFPDVSYPTIRMIMTSMYFTVMIFSLLSGQISKKISKKIIVLAGLFIYGIMGIIGANMDTVSGLIISRIIMGCGVGLVLPQANALIVDFYESKKREKNLGYASGIANFGSMIGSIVGGTLAAISWAYNFYAFAFAFVIFILVLAGVPNTAVVSKRVQQEDTAVKKALPPMFYLLAIAIFFVQVYALITPTNMAKFYLGEKIGPAGLLGITMALITGAAFIAGFILPYIRSVFKNFTPAFACVLTGIGFVTLYSTTSVVTTMAAQILIGFANGILLPSVFIANSQVVSAEKRQLSMSILSAVMYLGCFMTSYLQTWVGSVSGNTSQRFMFLVFGIGAFIALILVLLLSSIFKNRTVQNSMVS